ncbi:MAG TPA: VOC family protein [Terriglobales bacterium]|nr:VOC family protein [Terriglobales bacterium]
MKLNTLLQFAYKFFPGIATIVIFCSTLTAQTQVSGLDHIPVVVTDLEKAQADFRAMGFAIKPGRFHADGIRNAHIKFPDGTEIELITATSATDDLTSEYLDKMKKGEGPVYFGLYAPDLEAIEKTFRKFHIAAQSENDMLTFASGSPLHPLFIGGRNKTLTDKPEHFAHPNTATRLSGLWVRDTPELRALLEDLDVPLTPMTGCRMLQVNQGIQAALPEGNLYLVASDDANVIAATVEVRELSAVETSLKQSGIPVRRDPTCGIDAVWIPPANGHGIWIEFVSARGNEGPKGSSR